MDESSRLLNWLLRDTLQRHYAGNKTLMAKDLGIDRHTLWRTFRVGDGEKGHISSLAAQQLLWCCMRHNYSLDNSIQEFVEQNFQESAHQCRQVKDWIQSTHVGKLDIIKRVIPEWQNILECSQLNDRLETHPIHCKFKQTCPILRLMEITQSESKQSHKANRFLEY